MRERCVVKVWEGIKWSLRKAEIEGVMADEDGGSVEVRLEEDNSEPTGR